MNQIAKLPTTLSLPPCAMSLLANNAGWTDGAPTRWEPPKTISPREREELAAAIRALRSSLVPADPLVTMECLTRLKVHATKAPEKSEAEWRLIFRDYARDLAEFPADIIHDGCETYRKTTPWWPHVSDLLALMEPKLAERRDMLARAEKLAAGGPEKPSRYVAGPEERKRIADGFLSAADILRNMPGPGGV